MPAEATIPSSLRLTDPLHGRSVDSRALEEIDALAALASRLLNVPTLILAVAEPALRVIGRSDESVDPLPEIDLVTRLLERHRATGADLLTSADLPGEADPQMSSQRRATLSVGMRSGGSGVAGCLVALDQPGRGWSDQDRAAAREAAALADVAYQRFQRAKDAEWLEDAVQIQAAYLDHLFEHAPEAISLLDSEMRILSVNPEYTRIFGFTPEEVIGRQPDGLTVPREEAERARGFVGRALRGEQVRAEVMRRRKDGTDVSVSMHCLPVRISREQVGAYVICRDLTREIDARAAMERNEQRFRALIENAMDIVAVIGHGGTIDYVTPSVERLLGRTSAELIGANAFGLIHPDDAPQVIARFSSVLRAPCDRAMEMRIRALGDEWRTLEVRAKNMAADPAVAGVVINARDITDERQAKQMQRQLDAFLEATPDLVATFDPHGRALSVNRAFRNLLDLEGRPIRELTLTDLFPPAVTERLLHEGIPMASRQGVWTGETFVQGSDGVEVPISQVVLAHKSGAGTMEFISTLARDISAQKEAESALRRSEAHFRSLIENASDIICIADVEGKLTFVSPAVQRVLGYEPEELLGRSIFSLVHEDQIGDMGQSFTRIIQGEALPTAEFRIRHKDGTWRRIEAASQNLLSQAAVGGVVINCRDVTERRAAEQALTESQEQLVQAQKMEAIGRLAGGIAHDFNNLLTAIKGFTELLLLDFEEKDPRRGFASEIQGAATRAADLTRQLLAFSRRQVLQPEVLDLNRSVGEMEKMLERLIGEDVRMLCTLDPHIGRVKADPGQIEQVLMNLVVNARDAMPAGGELRIRTSNAALTDSDAQAFPYVQPGRYVLLEVSDTGTGMSQEVQDRIFEPFFTTKEQGKGTGLGLSTVYGIIKQSGGYIWLQSEEGQGTTFRIYLPRLDGAVTKRSSERSDRGSLEGTETILLVEDEVAVRTLVRRVLERTGYRVVEAGNGTQALALVEAGRLVPDLLLTDVIMPGMSGRELADRLEPRLKGLRVLYMSGYTDEAIVHHGVLDEGVAFLEKPFTPDVLLRKLRDVLDAAPAEII